MLFTSVAIGQSNYFGFGFTPLNWKPLLIVQRIYSSSLFQAPREMREGECEGTKTRGEWGREKEGKKRSL